MKASPKKAIISDRFFSRYNRFCDGLNEAFEYDVIKATCPKGHGQRNDDLNKTLMK